MNTENKTLIKKALDSGIAIRQSGSINISALSRAVSKSVPTVKKALDELCSDGFVKNNIWNYVLAETVEPHTTGMRIKKLMQLLNDEKYLKPNGKANLSAIAKKLDISRSTVYSYIEAIKE